MIPDNVDIESDAPVDYLFLIMEYLEHDLKFVINQCSKGGSKMKEAHIITITYNLLCNLNFIHSAGLIHRDIKPDNILTNDNCYSKLCDFGLARTIIEPIHSFKE